MRNNFDELNNVPNFLLHEYLGAHPEKQGYSFAVWAPHAKKVAVVGDFNNWDFNQDILSFDEESGIWFGNIDRAKAGDIYKYWILGADDIPRYKADPYARKSELRPHDGSILYQEKDIAWVDQDFWNKEDVDYTATPMNIYEVHLGSWKRHDDGSFYNYRELAHELGEYCLEMAYTHIELMPVMEHPEDDSFGYNISYYFSPSARFGDKEDLQYMINYLHKLGIKVIFDWVPAYFPKYDFALANFDGTALYEANWQKYPDSFLAAFDYSKKEVKAFLLSSAYYWISEFHADGLRIPDVASMIFREHSFHSAYTNDYNTSVIYDDAVNFIRELTTMVKEEFKGVATIAEDNGLYGKTTLDVESGGLGFDLKWDQAFTEDTLQYFSTPFEKRSEVHNTLNYSMMYNFFERYILSLSHNEVINGYGSLISKMPGDYWKQFASLRVLILYQLAHPGTKLMFMGGEIAQFIEWNYNESLQWFLLQYDMHRMFHDYVKAANRFYLQNKAMWIDDKSWHGFTWLIADDAKNCVYSFVRRDNEDNLLIFIFNMQADPVDAYKIPVPKRGVYKIVFNSDDLDWGGSGYNILKDTRKNNLHEDNYYYGDPIYGWHVFAEELITDYDKSDLKASGTNGLVYSRDIANKNHEQSLKLNLPPSAAVVLEYVYEDKSPKPKTPWPDPELPYPKDFNPYNKAADEGFELNS